jgi:hypothetical protein
MSSTIGPIDVSLRESAFVHRKVKLKSGSLIFKNSEQFKRTIREAVVRAVEAAWNQLWGEFEPTIALQFGRLRMAVKGMIRSQMLNLLNRSKFSIQWLELSGPAWWKYHVFGGGGEALSDRPYDRPTTKGTRPLNVFKFMDRFEDLIIKHMNIEFVALGLKYKQFAKVL